MAKRELRKDYTSEACNQVVTLMGTGLSLTAAAGLMGFSRATINCWIDDHEEFKDAVSRGKAARVFFLERQMFTSKNTAVINACRFALMNAAPEEWREKPAVDPETTDSPLRVLAEQISGNAIRPRLPEPKIVEHEPVASGDFRPQKRVTLGREPRIHTISPESYKDEE